MIIEWDKFFSLTSKRNPDFSQLEKVLQRQRPDRPVLFEFFLNDALEKWLASRGNTCSLDGWADYKIRIYAFRNAGYDYITFGMPGFVFPKADRHRAETISLNEGVMIRSWEDFENYPWPDPEKLNWEWLDQVAKELPEGMKIIIYGPCGVEENVIQLMGYENLCFAMVDEPDLVKAVFDRVGSILERYYTIAGQHPAVGACISNDDWGFKTQTLLSVKQMKEYLFPWHQRIVEQIHRANKPAILHSCGYFLDILDILVDELHYDGRHSYEDNILPVEKAYEILKGKIAVLGGVDVDFLCRGTPEQVYKRAESLLDLTREGGYALGSGNSIPPYIPWDNYQAMILPAILNT